MKTAMPNYFHQIVWPLAIAETVIWAATYYAFPALLLEWERDLGWSKAELSIAFTFSIIVSALLAPVVGRVIDRGYGTYIFTGGAISGAIILALLSGITSLWQFYLLWILLGIVMAATLYEPCFAILTRAMGERKTQAITIVTLVAGFAGSVSFLSTHTLVGFIGWRGAILVLAGAVFLLATPLIWFGCRAVDRTSYTKAPVASHKTTETLTVVGNGAFWLLAIGFSAIALDHGVLLTHLLPLLNERGVPSDTAIFAASLIGPMQVAGRLAMVGAERRLSTLAIFSACFIAMGIAALCLLGASAVPILLFSFVLFQGAGYGVTSILRPIVTAELLGQKNFGVIAGLLAVPFLVAAAAAPTVAALIWQVGGYDWVIGFAGGVSIIGLVALLAAARLARRIQQGI